MYIPMLKLQNFLQENQTTRNYRLCNGLFKSKSLKNLSAEDEFNDNCSYDSLEDNYSSLSQEPTFVQESNIVKYQVKLDPVDNTPYERPEKRYIRKNYSRLSLSQEQTNLKLAELEAEYVTRTTFIVNDILVIDE